MRRTLLFIVAALAALVGFTAGPAATASADTACTDVVYIVNDTYVQVAQTYNSTGIGDLTEPESNLDEDAPLSDNDIPLCENTPDVPLCSTLGGECPKIPLCTLYTRC